MSVTDFNQFVCIVPGTSFSHDVVFQILTTVHRFRVVLTTSVPTWSMAIRARVQLAMSRTTPALNA